MTLYRIRTDSTTNRALAALNRETYTSRRAAEAALRRLGLVVSYQRDQGTSFAYDSRRDMQVEARGHAMSVAVVVGWNDPTWEHEREEAARLHTIQ